LSPFSILFPNRADVSEIKISGFRFAKSTDETSTSGIFNTLDISFQSPEAIDTVKPCTKKVDSWAIGCIAYFCLTGAYPFAADNKDKQIIEILTKNVTETECWSEISP